MITSLSLFTFRNYWRESVALRPGTNLLLGDNAQGKTNLLEALYLGATGRSPRASTLAEMVMWEQPAARLVVGFVDATPGPGTAHELEVRLDRDGARTKRSLTIDGRPLSAAALAGRIRTVLFHPEEMTLIRGSGEGRRRLLNAFMSQAVAGYAGLLNRYARVLEQRNQLLKRVAQELEPVGALQWWTEELARTGGEVVDARAACLARLGPVVAEKYRVIAAGEELELRYAPSPGLGAHAAAGIAAELGRRQREELARGVTVAGPHRDDLEFHLGGLPAAAHASQGQQRTAILAVKLAEVELLAGVGAPPLLLLDDVMSELDAQRRAHLLEVVEAAPQAVITAAEQGYFPPGFAERVSASRVIAGHLEAMA